MTEAQNAAAPRIRGIHHSAYRCRDAAETRDFYEGLFGLSAAAAMTFDREPGTNRPLHYMHIFFELGDGNYLAFFELPERVEPGQFAPRSGFDQHVAFEAADEASLVAFRDKLTARGIPAFGPIDHGFVKSIYSWDPNGIQVEVTCRVAEHDRILDHEKAQVESQMAAWAALKAKLAADAPA